MPCSSPCTLYSTYSQLHILAPSGAGSCPQKGIFSRLPRFHFPKLVQGREYCQPPNRMDVYLSIRYIGTIKLLQQQQQLKPTDSNQDLKDRCRGNGNGYGSSPAVTFGVCTTNDTCRAKSARATNANSASPNACHLLSAHADLMTCHDPYSAWRERPAHPIRPLPTSRTLPQVTICHNVFIDHYVNIVFFRW